MEDINNWEYYNSYQEYIEYFLNSLNIPSSDFNCYYDKTIYHNTRYEKNNEYGKHIVLDLQLLRYIMRCNSIAMDETVRSSSYFDTLYYLFVLNQCSIDSLPYFAYYSQELFVKSLFNGKKTYDLSIWESFDFNKCINITEWQCRILFGHEIYHQYLSENPNKEHMINDLKKTLLSVYGELIEDSSDDNIFEECLCDRFAVKALIEKESESLEEILTAYANLLFALAFIRISGYSLASIANKKPFEKVIGKQVDLFKVRFSTIVEYLLAYYTKNNIPINYELFENINSTEINNMVMLFKFILKDVQFLGNYIIENNQDDFIRYYLDPLSSDPKLDDAVSELMNAIQKMILDKFDVFDSLIIE